jgi:hypothetical protein
MHDDKQQADQQTLNTEKQTEAKRHRRKLPTAYRITESRAGVKHPIMKKKIKRYQIL